MDKWQQNWTQSNKGRTTFGFLPDVRKRLKMEWMKPDHYVTQLLSGHGDFQAKLHSMKLTENADCECGLPQTAEHILRECSKRKTIRDKIKEDLGLTGNSLGEDELVKDEESFKIFKKYAKDQTTRDINVGVGARGRPGVPTSPLRRAESPGRPRARKPTQDNRPTT